MGQEREQRDQRNQELAALPVDKILATIDEIYGPNAAQAAAEHVAETLSDAGHALSEAGLGGLNAAATTIESALHLAQDPRRAGATAMVAATIGLGMGAMRPAAAAEVPVTRPAAAAQAEIQKAAPNLLLDREAVAENGALRNAAAQYKNVSVLDTTPAAQYVSKTGGGDGLHPAAGAGYDNFSRVTATALGDVKGARVAVYGTSLTRGSDERANLGGRLKYHLETTSHATVVAINGADGRGTKATVDALLKDDAALAADIIIIDTANTTDPNTLAFEVGQIDKVVHGRNPNARILLTTHTTTRGARPDQAPTTTAPAPSTTTTTRPNDRPTTTTRPSGNVTANTAPNGAIDLSNILGKPETPAAPAPGKTPVTPAKPAPVGPISVPSPSDIVSKVLGNTAPAQPVEVAAPVAPPATEAAPALPAEMPEFFTDRGAPITKDHVSTVQAVATLTVQEGGLNPDGTCKWDKLNNWGSGAYGCWQIMQNNPPNMTQWAIDTFGHPLPRNEWTRENQARMAMQKFDEYYGGLQDWRAVAIAWYAGPGRAETYVRAMHDGDMATVNRILEITDNTLKNPADRERAKVRTYVQTFINNLREGYDPYRVIPEMDRIVPRTPPPAPAPVLAPPAATTPLAPAAPGQPRPIPAGAEVTVSADNLNNLKQFIGGITLPAATAGAETGSVPLAEQARRNAAGAGPAPRPAVASGPVEIPASVLDQTRNLLAGLNIDATPTARPANQPAAPGTTPPPTEAAPPPPPAPEQGSHPMIDTGSIRSVEGGIQIVNLQGRGDAVNIEIADNLARMFDEAEQAGFHFVITDGYRDAARQAQLRAQNPSNAAPAGRSLHQSGKAVDLSLNGGPINYGSPASNWLINNAPRFGLHNLKGEAWHYSVTGH